MPSIAVQTGAQVRLVDVTEDYYLDIEDLKKKITSKSKVLILSYMRGYVGNVDAIVNLCQQHNIKVVEDCAHTMGLRWKGTPVGRKGIISCYSMQSYKMINAGEGGIFVTDDEDLCAKAILYAGAYERLWKSHINRPKDIAHLQKKIPCLNVRMNNITAAIIRAQLLTIHEKIEKQNQNDLPPKLVPGHR
ncbi:aminotransferase class V-fold PLP-dependent enzyme [Candidiatus Paracoxiella cheracis]|uniref:aminotransferase class V-fold PLP-dependent enzyme n=1 Tax=Candidiatus Paracoxiella cheracis TaxID=3405120 RepID=UPI003BF5EB30